MEIVKINGKIKSVADEWNELTIKEARTFANCILSGVEKEDLKLQLLLVHFPELKKILKKLEKVQRNGDHIQFWEKTEELTIELDKLFNFLYDELKIDDRKVEVVSSKLTRQLVPTIKNLVGPSDFSKLEIWEFSLAEMAFEEYFKTGEAEHLNRLVAILYRPKKWMHGIQKRMARYNGDPRQPFNDQSIAKRSNTMKRVSMDDKYLVSLWFEGWLKQLPNLFPKLYEKKKKNTEAPDGGSWSDTILLIANSEHKEADQVARRNLFQFLRERELQIIQKEQMDAELAKLKKKKT